MEIQIYTSEAINEIEYETVARGMRNEDRAKYYLNLNNILKKGQPRIFLTGKNLTVAQATFATVWIRACLIQLIIKFFEKIGAVWNKRTISNFAQILSYKPKPKMPNTKQLLL